MALVALDIALLVLGIIYHINFMIMLCKEGRRMTPEELIHVESLYPPSMALITAVLLLLIGIAAIVSMIFRVGPF